MYVIYKYIYNIIINQLNIWVSEIDIKYKTKSITKIESNGCYQAITTGEHLFLRCNGLLYIFGKDQIVVPNIFGNIIYKIYLIENFLIVLDYYRTVIYDINTKTIITERECRCFHIDISPNGCIMFRSTWYNIIYESIDDYISYNTKLEIETFHGHMYWVDDNKILGIRYFDNYAKYFIIDKKVCNEKIFICPPNENISEQNYVIGNKCVCIRYNNILLIEDENVKIVDNVFNIKFYNRCYDVFISDETKMFKLIDDHFVLYCFQYDLWRDTDKPNVVQDIVDALIECDLFPPEIYNVIYQQIIKS